jgi:uncharacterized protein involved in response to NO
MLMIQGFEQSFVLGFLLTAFSGFTHGERCRPSELAIAALSAVFALAFVAEWAGLAPLGAFLRAGAASAVGLLVWKLWRLPGRRALPAFVLWSLGWLVLTGLWVMALVPTFALGALHLVFIGGFAFLTLGIGTRVVVAHGHHPLTDESRALSPLVVTMVAFAVLARLAAEWMPARASLLLGMSGAVWMLGWLLWAVRALPRIVRTKTAVGR